jgi:hypothetical protein
MLDLWVNIVAVGVNGVVAIYFIRELYRNRCTDTPKFLRIYDIGAAILCIILMLINLCLYIGGN